MQNISIRRMEAEDLPAAAEVHQRAFPRQTFSANWLTCHFRAFAFVELEQIAVEPKEQGRGIGTKLIVESLPMVGAKIAERGAVLKTIVVNTRADNYAQELYRKTIGAETVATIGGIFAADEVYMVARNVDRLLEKQPIKQACS
jgi:ribosomal protein S18 acetylase RimI-like enzyme